MSTSPAKSAAGAANEQVVFLLACIKYSENGRPNFEKVAADCGITSKGAAAKRYERLLKANGIPLPSQRGKDGEMTPKKRGKPAATDAEDDGKSPSKKPRAKKAVVKKEVKDEDEDEDEEDED